jgi:hypothetical protein
MCRPRSTSSFKRLHENWALYQGTTLVVPLPIYKDVG